MPRRPDVSKVGTVGERLRFARNCKQYTLDWARKKTGIPKLTVQDYERGERSVPLDRLRWLAKLYDTTERWLIYGEGEPPPLPPPPLTDVQRIMRCL